MGNNLKGREYQKYVLNIMALYKQRPDLKAYLELLLSIGTVAILTIFAIKPTLVTIADLFTKIKSEQDTSNEMDLKIKNLGIAQTIYTQNQAKISLLSQAVPETSEVASYVRQTEGVIKKENLSPVTISVDTVKLTEATNSGLINVTTSVSGAYSGFVNFIKDIEALRRPSFISKLDLVSITDQGKRSLNLTTTTQVPYN